ASTGISEPFAIFRDAQIAERTARREKLSHLAVGHVDRENPVGVFVGFGMVRGGRDQAVVRGQPFALAHLPRTGDESARFVGVDVEEPKAGRLIVFIDDVSVVFVLFLFFFVVGL